MPSDITKYGIAGLRGLRGLNHQPTEEELALQEARRERNRVLTGGVGPSLEDTTSTHAYSEDSPMRDWGTSKYDEQFMNAPLTEEGVQDTRYENQPWYDTLANGLGKALGTAGTTFVSSLVGLPYGLIQAGVQGRWSALWDNDVTQALSDADDWLEENLTNYRSTQQQQNPWWSKDNLFSMNFIADDVIKNMGFTLGAAASMAVGSGSLGLLSKSLGIVNDVSKGSKMANAAAAALFSATGEGMIEARQGVEERNKLEQQKLNDALAPEYNELQAEQEAINQRYALTGDYQTYKAQLDDWSARKSALDERKTAGEQQIEESGREMGNKILLGNQVLLTAGNMIQFGKAMTKSFDNARHAAEITSKSAKPFGVKAVKAGKDFADGYVLKGKGWGRLSAATKGLLTEGSEEMNQQFIQSAAGAAYTEEDVNDYWKAKLDPEAYRETTKGLYTLGNILDRGFQDSWGSPEQWEQFVIGGLTGATGSFSPTKIFNQDKTKSRLDPRRYGSWEGGAYREVQDFNKAYNQYSENIDELNKVLAQEDFGSRTQNLIAHTYLEGNKEYAAANNDKKAWKDEDDKQAIHDIQAFLRAGKLDDLRAIYDEMGKNLSDDDIQSIVKGTSTEKEIEGKKVMSGPFFDDKGNQIKSNDEIREEIKHNSEELNRKLDSYLDSIDYVNKRTGGQLTKDQEDNLAYLHNLSKEKDVRFQKIMSNVRKRLPNKFLIKTNSTPEQLKQQYASSDLAFSKDDNTPKGYVEVDTSLMNDQNFGAFFADTILWGDNIQAGYTKEDLIEELEAREEDKKYSEEEQKKRKEERAKKQQERDAKKAEEAEADRKEQQDKNVYLIRQAFVDNAMQKEGKSLVQALNDDALEEIFSDINDALELRNEAAEFENTLMEYMLNPQKVDKAKQKAEKDNEEKAKKAAEDKATVQDMMEMSDDDLAAAVLGGRKGKNKNGKKAQKAMGMKNGRSKAEKSLEDAVASGKITREAADDALKLLDSQMGRMLQENDEEDYGDMKSVASVLFDTDTEAMNDEETLWDDDFRDAVVNGTVEADDKIEASYQARLDAAKDAINFIAEDVESQLADYDQSIDMSKQFKDTETEDEKGTKELDEEIGKAADEKKKSENPTSTSSRNKSESSEPLPSTKTRITTASTSKSASKTQPQSVEEPEPVMPEKEETAGTDEALEEDKKSGEKGNNGAQRNKVWGLWHTGVSEVGQLTNESWKADPSNPNAELQQKRYDAIRKKLIDSGAYTARKQGKIKPGMKVGFRIFQNVNDEAGDFVVFITDEYDNIIGDLPSEDARFNIERFPMSMEALYKALHDEWDDATDEERQAGMVSQYTTVIDDVFVGKVKYQEERQTVTSLTQGSEVKPLFAVKRIAKDGTGNMDTGVDEKGTPNVSGIHMPLTGRSGQPYVLIQVPGVHNGIGIKYLAVPIKTITVGEANTNNTIYIKVLKTLLDNIKQRKVSDFEARRLLEALLSVHSVHVNLDEGSDTKKELGIRITTHRSQSGITKGVPYTIYAGKREDMDVNAIITALSGIQVNVSSQLINGSGKTGEFGLAKFLTVNGNPVDYNEMLAEVSHTNAAEPMTVNDWFTIKPLQEKNNKLEVVENSVQMPAWDTVDVDNQTVYPNTDPGKKWTVKVSEGYTVYDEEGNPITTKTHGKEKAKEAAILAAEIFGKINNKPNNRPYAVLINSKSYIYDPVKRTFKTYKAAEKDPAYVYGKAAEGKKLTEQEKYTIMKDALERQMIELEEMYEERKRQQEASIPQQTGQEAQEKNNKDHTEEVNKVLEQMEEERKHFKLVKWDSKQKKYVEDKEGDYYRDDRDGSIHARVSNVNDADVDVIEANEKAGFRGKSPAFVPAVGSGNAVDTFVRRFYEEAVGLFEGINWNDKEEAEAAMELAEAVNEQIGVPNISKEDAKNLIIHLAKIKQQMGQDWEINSSGIVASGLVSFDGETIIKVAGTIDLLAYNKKTGQYVIIDMKSHLSPLFRKDGKLKTDVKTQAKIAHWRAQQTLYKQFLEAKYGIKISGLRIMPFGVNYSTDFKNTNYEVGDDGVLRDKGIVVDINPKYDGKLLGLTPKANTKYDVGQLPESIKRLLPRKGTAVVKQPEDEEIAVKGKLIDIRDSVPEGMKLSDFISEKYKKDATVMKLVETLESNKGTSSPIMMTQGSQNLLMDAIDQDALNKAIQEAKAAKENLKIEIPAQEEQSIDDIIDSLESQNVDSDAIDFIKDLPEDIQRKLSNGDALSLFLTMYNDGAEDAEIIQALQNIDLDIRNKKAVKEYTMIDLPKELKWMRENLPQLSSERRLHIVQGLIRCSDGTESFGQVNAAMILIGTQAAEGTVYHEAFHAVVQFLLTDDEINKLFDAAKKRWGDLPAASLEERMADEFENYMKGLDPEDSRIKRFFKELWKAIQAWLNRTGYIESLYRDINSGVYAGRDVRDDRSNALIRIRSEQRDHTKDYDFLTTDEQERLRDADISKNQWNQLTKEQQEYMLHCVV